MGPARDMMQYLKDEGYIIDLNTVSVLYRERAPAIDFKIKIDGADRTIVINPTYIKEMKDLAMAATRGGIDLTPANMNVEVKNALPRELNSTLTLPCLQQLQNAPGFVPVIINIQPVKDLRAFLGRVNKILFDI